MGHSHSHVNGELARAQAVDGPAPGVDVVLDRRRVRVVLTALVVPIVVATVVGLMLLWPVGKSPGVPVTQDAYAGVSFVNGSVQSIQRKACTPDGTDRQADGSIPTKATCTSVTVLVADGASAGRTVSVGIPPQVARSGVQLGDTLQLAHYPPQAGSSDLYAFVDFARELPLGLLAAGFALLVVVVARLRGLLAIVGLALGYATIAFFVIPALRHGENALLVGAVGATAIMLVILPLAHGISVKTTTALLGTVAGIWLSAGLATASTAAAHLNGLDSEENLALSRLTTGSGLGGIILCGIILAGLGVLNDVTITQASAVSELAEQAPHLSRRHLFGSGMRIGRDHLSSTVYTIAFAYAGAALPSLLLINIYGQPFRQMLSSGQVAEEIVRTLVGSIGLILAIPLTTAIAALVVSTSSTGRTGTPPGIPVPSFPSSANHPPSGRHS